MAKRVADRELNRDNWDEEDENAEEAGTFNTASAEDMSKRKIIKARRRITGDKKQDSTKESRSIFQGFTGFKGFSSTSSADVFGGSKTLPGISSNLNPKPTGFSGFGCNSTAGFSGFSGLSATNIPTTSPPQIAQVSTPTFNGHSNTKTPQKESNEKEHSDAYLESIKALNQGVSDWVQKHVTSNPYIDLTPVFDDYRKHMKEIERNEPRENESPGVAPLAMAVTPVTKPAEVITSTETKATADVTSGLFGAGTSLSNAETKTTVPLFGTGETKVVKNEEKPFAGLATLSAPQDSVASSSKQTDSKDDEEETPKPVSVVTAEKGSHFSIKCKLFFKRDTSWSELGIGMLNFKTVSEKTQLLIRADTATGNILLNIFLAPGMPISRSGKNNVMLVTVPNPPLYSKPSEGDNSKPATYLIRVKTAENADELYEKMKSHQTS
ncbi:predicted protein [Nematostella vectensis]|uniref:RanBD1 domain-containing protein n=1 Tax=Nematostella vectensis TaxID=45351 RepID=A7SQ74_NEMVE|nr:nuclear pore complex protein Nup50 [Nematostella vectensis]EDO34132.1 predicted protein [Nematostella vectensis]|eukprot:XP_001626232.1 predicted protein [Nematostella vectensis]